MAAPDDSQHQPDRKASAQVELQEALAVRWSSGRHSFRAAGSWHGTASLGRAGSGLGVGATKTGSAGGPLSGGLDPSRRAQLAGPHTGDCGSTALWRVVGTRRLTVGAPDAISPPSAARCSRPRAGKSPVNRAAIGDDQVSRPAARRCAARARWPRSAGGLGRRVAGASASARQAATARSPPAALSASAKSAPTRSGLAVANVVNRSKRRGARPPAATAELGGPQISTQRRKSARSSTAPV